MVSLWVGRRSGEDGKRVPRVSRWEHCSEVKTAGDEGMGVGKNGLSRGKGKGGVFVVSNSKPSRVFASLRSGG